MNRGLTKVFLLVKETGVSFRGFHTTVSVVGISSCETSMTPDSVLFMLRVGIVCPNCRGHLVPIITVMIPVTIKPLPPLA